MNYRWLSCGILFSLVFGSVLFSGCTGPLLSKTNYYESFYSSNAHTMYFVKPLKFESEQKECKDALIDFTFKNDRADSVTVNMTVTGRLGTELKSISFGNESNSVELESVKLLFNEKEGDLYVFRYSGKCLVAEFFDLFSVNGQVKMIVNSDMSSFSFVATKDAHKKIKDLLGVIVF